MPIGKELKAKVARGKRTRSNKDQGRRTGKMYRRAEEQATKLSSLPVVLTWWV